MLTLLSVLLLVVVHAVPSIAGGLPVDDARVPAALGPLLSALDPVPAAPGRLPAARGPLPADPARLPATLGPLPADLDPLPADLGLLTAALGPSPAALGPSPADLAARAMAALFMADPASTSPTSSGQPPCTADVCQPMVAVPGFEPRWDDRGRRTDLFLSMLVRMDLGAPSSVARWVALTGVTVDYRMPDRTQALQFNVFWRVRIGAFGAPLVWTE